MADGEGTSDGHDPIPSINEEHGDAQGGLSSTKAASVEFSVLDLAPTAPTTSIDVALVSLPVSKQSQPPKILPKLNVSHDDTLVKGKGLEEELQGSSPSNQEVNLRFVEGLKLIDPELVRLRMEHLQNTKPDTEVESSGRFRHQALRKDLSSEHIRNVEALIKKCQKFGLNEILSRETNFVFLQQLLDDIYSLDMDKATTPSPSFPSVTNSTSTGDLVLEGLAAAPSCYCRENAAVLFVPILDGISWRCLVQK